MNARYLLGALGFLALSVGGCGPGDHSPSPPSLEWDAMKYGLQPAHRPLSAVAVVDEGGWVVAREMAHGPGNPPAVSRASCTARLRISGMDCGNCQQLVANELGRVDGVREARISQPDLSGSPQANNSAFQPEAVVEYDPGKVNPKQIEGTIAALGLWPRLSP
jgi:copper chaperone CopZ